LDCSSKRAINKSIFGNEAGAKLTLATLARGGNAGAEGGLAELEAERSQPKGPRLGGNEGGGAETGGVLTPELALDTDPRFREGSSGGIGGNPAGPLVVASTSEEGRVLSVDDSSRDISVRGSDVVSVESRCWYRRGDFSRFEVAPLISLRVSMLFLGSIGSAGSEAGVTVLDVASTKLSLSCQS
jgi:hypothetical protein